MKIIFLDIDGVLNSHQYDLCRGECDGNIDASRLPLLKQLIMHTGAQVVLTSSWRKHWDPKGTCADDVGRELIYTFSKHGIALFDRTPEINNDRAKEIRAWLCAHPEVDTFVVFDDVKFGWGEFDSNVVKTDYRIGRGLEQKHIEKAINILLKAE